MQVENYNVEYVNLQVGLKVVIMLQFLYLAANILPNPRLSAISLHKNTRMLQGKSLRDSIFYEALFEKDGVDSRD